MVGGIDTVRTVKAGTWSPVGRNTALIDLLRTSHLGDHCQGSLFNSTDPNKFTFYSHRSIGASAYQNQRERPHWAWGQAWRDPDRLQPVGRPRTPRAARQAGRERVLRHIADP